MNVLTETSGPPLEAPVSDHWLFDRIEVWTQRDPGKCAFVVDHPGGSEEYTYADVSRFAERIAAGLQKRGIRRGDRVGILMENLPQWVFALLGTLRLGAVAVPLATALPEQSLQRVVQHAGCRFIFTDGQNAEKGCNVASSIGAEVVAFHAK